MGNNHKYDRPAHDLLKVLRSFLKLKKSRWEEIEASIQMSNRLGTPSEDWIIPPDEEKALTVLNEDEDYVSLRKSIEILTPQTIKLAREQNFDLHHKLDWVRFIDPLIGTAALEDAIEALELFTQDNK
ncbi:MAG: hypothetical protein KDK62_07180 [Chlamydiia bacterium]|nr:hypothetical protein [Chlamydiia bacterium]